MDAHAGPRLFRPPLRAGRNTPSLPAVLRRLPALGQAGGAIRQACRAMFSLRCEHTRGFFRGLPICAANTAGSPALLPGGQYARRRGYVLPALPACGRQGRCEHTPRFLQQLNSPGVLTAFRRICDMKKWMFVVEWRPSLRRLSCSAGDLRRFGARLPCLDGSTG